MPPSASDETALAVSRRVGEHARKARASGQQPSLMRALGLGYYALSGGDIESVEI
jgi:hypothetical protein